MDLTRYDQYLRSLGRSPHTVAERVRFARRWTALWPSLDVPAHDVADWLRRYDGWTRTTYHAHLRGLYAWLLDEGLVDADPTARLKRPPEPKSLPTPLTEPELTRALVEADERTRAFLLLGYLAGLRRHEIAKIRGRDVSQAVITVVGKGSQKWTIPTHPRLWELAQTYPGRDWWFPSPAPGRVHLAPNTVSQAIAELFRSVGIRSGAAHRARHTYGTDLLRRGANVRVVQTLMRHSSLATTERYLLVEEDERRAAVTSLLPPALPPTLPPAA